MMVIMSSKQPRKQRKGAYDAPLHKRLAFVHAHLSKDLHKQYGKRAMPVHKGDTVRVMSGKYKKRAGKVLSVNLRYGTIEVDGIMVKSAKGTEKRFPLKACTVEITNLELNDEKRLKTLKRK